MRVLRIGSSITALGVTCPLEPLNLLVGRLEMMVIASGGGGKVGLVPSIPDPSAPVRFSLCGSGRLPPTRRTSSPDLNSAPGAFPAFNPCSLRFRSTRRLFCSSLHIFGVFQDRHDTAVWVAGRSVGPSGDTDGGGVRLTTTTESGGLLCRDGSVAPCGSGSCDSSPHPGDGKLLGGKFAIDDQSESFATQGDFDEKEKGSVLLLLSLGIYSLPCTSNPR